MKFFMEIDPKFPDFSLDESQISIFFIAGDTKFPDYMGTDHTTYHTIL